MKKFENTFINTLRAGPCLYIKTAFPRYGDSHVKDKTVIFNIGIPIPIPKYIE